MEVRGIIEDGGIDEARVRRLDQKEPAGGQHAMPLRQPRGNISEVLDDMLKGDRIHRCVAQSEPIGGSTNHRNVWETASGVDEPARLQVEPDAAVQSDGR